MTRYALQVIADPDHDGQFHWVVLQEGPDDTLSFIPHSAGERGFDSYADGQPV